MATEIGKLQPQAGLIVQLHRAIRWAKMALSISGVLFFVIFAGELLRIYQTASGVSPWLGYAVAGVFAILGLLAAIPFIRFLKTPRAVQPPPLPESADAMRISHLLAECRFLDRYLANGSRNPELTDKAQQIDAARIELAGLHRKVAAASESQIKELGKELTTWHDKQLVAVLKDLDKRVDRMIYQESLTVGLATAASPNGTLDAFVMLWRSMKLVSQIATAYYGRPGLWGTLAVCKDVSIATAMAGYLQNVTDSLGNLVAKSVGGVTGVVAGPAVDGVTNALVLIRIGYLAKERCRSTRRWDLATRKNALVRALASTQRVAVGLTTEILRQTFGGLSAVAGVVGGGIATAAYAAKDGVAGVAGAAKTGVVQFTTAAWSGASNAAEAAKAGVICVADKAKAQVVAVAEAASERFGHANENIVQTTATLPPDGWRGRLKTLQFWKRV